MLGQNDEAISIFDQVLELDPDYELAQKNKELALEAKELEPYSFLTDYGDLLFQLAFVGGVVLVGYLWRRRKKKGQKSSELHVGDKVSKRKDAV